MNTTSEIEKRGKTLTSGIILHETSTITALITEYEEIEIRLEIALPHIPHLKLTHCLFNNNTVNATTHIQEIVTNFLKEMFAIDTIEPRNHLQELEILQNSIILPKAAKRINWEMCTITGQSDSTAVDLSSQCKLLKIEDEKSLYLSNLCTTNKKTEITVEFKFAEKVSILVLHKTRSHLEHTLSFEVEFPETLSMEPYVSTEQLKSYGTTSAIVIDIQKAANATLALMDILYPDSENPAPSRKQLTLTITMTALQSDTDMNSVCSSFDLISVTAIADKNDNFESETTRSSRRTANRIQWPSRRQRARIERARRLNKDQTSTPQPTITTTTKSSTAANTTASLDTANEELLQRNHRVGETYRRHFDRDEYTTVIKTTTAEPKTKFNLEERLELGLDSNSWSHDSGEFDDSIDELEEALTQLIYYRKKRSALSFLALGAGVLSYEANRRNVKSIRSDQLELNKMQMHYSRELDRKINSLTVAENDDGKLFESKIENLCVINRKIELELIEIKVNEQLDRLILKLLRQESLGGKSSPVGNVAKQICLKKGNYPLACETYFQKYEAEYLGVSPTFTQEGTINVEQIFLVNIPSMANLGPALEVHSIGTPLGIKEPADKTSNQKLYSFLEYEVPESIIHTESDAYDVSDCKKIGKMKFCSKEDLSRSNSRNFCAISLIRDDHPACPSKVIMTSNKCIGKHDSRENLLVAGFATPTVLESKRNLPMGRNTQSPMQESGSIRFYESGKQEFIVNCDTSWWTVAATGNKEPTKVVKIRITNRNSDMTKEAGEFLLSNSKLDSFRKSQFYNQTALIEADQNLENKLSLLNRSWGKLQSWSVKTKIAVGATASVFLLIIACILYHKIKSWISNIYNWIPCLKKDKVKPPKKKPRKKRQRNSRSESSISNGI